MSITRHFKGSNDQYGYGYFAYIEDGQLVIGENWPREGVVTYRGTYRDASRRLDKLKDEAPKLYNSIVKYYTEQENEEMPHKLHDELPNKKPVREVTTSPAGVLWKVKLYMKNQATHMVLVRGLSESSVINKLFPKVPEVLTLQTYDAQVIAVRSAEISVAEFMEDN